MRSRRYSSRPAIAYGTDGADVCSTRYGPRRSPVTRIAVSNSDGSVTSTSSRTTSSGFGRWSSCSSASLRRYSSTRAGLLLSPGRGSCATSRSGSVPHSAISSAAVSSSSTSVIRSSNARTVRDSSETIRIPAMKQAAIFTPSGRSTMLAAVVHTNTSEITANPTNTGRRDVRRAESVTAIDADVISTSTPVA